MGLVIGPGHGMVKDGCTGPDKARLDSSWVGAFPGEGTFLFQHIKRAVEITAANPEAQLIFSGGDTQRAFPGRSEAQSAYEIARDHDWFGFPEVAHRCHQERDARDSAQNLIFSILLHHRITKRFPDRVIVVGWGFKATRFLGGHAIPLKRFEGKIEYVGVNNPPLDNFPHAIAGELDKLQAMVRDQDWILEGPRWQAQRRERNPRGIPHPYSADMAALVGRATLL